MIYLTHYRSACSSQIELFDDIQYPQRVHWCPELYARAKSGMFYVPHRLVEKVFDPELCAYLKEHPVAKSAFILAAGNGHFAGYTQRPYPDNRLQYVYRFLPLSLTQVYAGRLAQGLGITDQVTTDSSACASSLKALMDVQTLIRYYGFNRVVVISVEDPLTNAVLEFFGETGASLTLKDEADGTKPSAFDSSNRGFYVGQGAALAVFESNDAVARLGLTPHARLLGAYTTSESSTNPIGQREDGQGYGKAIEGALHASGVTPDRIAIVKTHGTGTVSNNRAETTALQTSLHDFIATSYKQKIGHTMGASGLLETLLLLDDMKRGQIPAIENRTEKDPVFLSEPATVPDGLILSLASGMGNVYSAVVLDPVL